MKVNYSDIAEIYEKEVKMNTKNKKKVFRFERYKSQYLAEIYDSLSKGVCPPIRYNIFMIKSPKYRVVMSLNIMDKIINHYFTRFVLMPKLEKYLDIRNVATRKGLGLHVGINMVKKYLEVFKGKKQCYVLKMDISKYFYSIDHDVLKNMIKDDLDDEEFKILETILNSTNEPYVNATITRIKSIILGKVSKRREEVEKIPLYAHNKGLPIGNMSSQFLSIFYLNRLDHLIVHDFHLKYYVRYMDDILIFSDDKSKLIEVRDFIKKELSEKYLLDLNDKKTTITNIKDGVVFCGYRFRIIDNKTVINVSKGTRERVKKRLKEVRHLYMTDRISLASAFSSVNTYSNGFKFGSQSKIKRMIERKFFG